MQSTYCHWSKQKFPKHFVCNLFFKFGLNMLNIARVQTFPDITILRHGVTAFFQRFSLVYIGLNVWINDPVLNCTGESGNHLSEHTFQQLRKNSNIEQLLVILKNWTKQWLWLNQETTYFLAHISASLEKTQILNNFLVILKYWTKQWLWLNQETIYLFAHISASWKIQMLGKTRILENF